MAGSRIPTFAMFERNLIEAKHGKELGRLTAVARNISRTLSRRDRDLSRCPRERHMMYSGVAAGFLRWAGGGAQWQGLDVSSHFRRLFQTRRVARRFCLSDVGRRVLFAPPVATDARH